jgi:tetratricopeptide (TPR) repeat protein
MARVLVTFLLAFVLVPTDLISQATLPTKSPDSSVADSQPPRKESSASQDATPPARAAVPAASPFALQGRALEIGGGVIVGATVSVSRFADPSRRLAETSTDSRGNFSLALPDSEKTSELVLKASTPSGLEGYELPGLISAGDDNLLRLRLRKPGENYDDPSADALDAWLLERLKVSCGPKPNPTCGSGTLGVMISFKRRKPAAWDRVAEALGLLREGDAPEVRLVAAAALMRLGAWQTAGAMIDGVKDSRFNLEKAVLEGVRLNFIRYPHEASQLLEHTLQGESVDPFVQLELGRAAVMEEDWPGALQKLDPALKEKKLAPYAHYLRARALFALGDIEAAAQEAKLLTRTVKKKNLPVHARTFIDDLQGRLDEKSIRAIRSVMTQPIAELQKAVPSLEKLDASPPLAGQELPVILKKVGDNIEKFFREFANTSSLEVLRQSSLDNNGRSHAIRRAEMYYVFQQKSLKGRPMLEEIRGTGDGKLQTIGGMEDGFMASTGFASSLIVFHPVSQPTVDYRYLGRQQMAGRTVLVVGFAQRPNEATPMGIFRSTARQATARVFVQGVAWISADQYQVVRLRTDLLSPIVEADLDRQTSEIDYRPYQFLTTSKSYLLPSRVTVSIEWRKRRLRNEHIFSRYWLFNVEADSSDDRQATRTAKIPQPVAAH